MDLKRLFRFPVLMITALGACLAVPALAQSSRYSCDRACLMKIADSYFQALGRA